MGYGYEWAPYVPVAERRRKAMAEVARLAKKGQAASPVVIEGRTIAASFWGKAWCDNLESYSDHDNRLPRGRTYCRNGSVVDLQIKGGQVTAMVSGSELYRIAITIEPLPKARWRTISDECAGKIDSLVELLKGRFSSAIMEVMIREKTGVFPAPREMRFKCSCPDSAHMCKHVAATLYGVGARLDQQPELLFTLRQVDHLELLSRAGTASLVDKAARGDKAAKKKMAAADLGGVFGIDLDDGDVMPQPAAAVVKATPLVNVTPAIKVAPATKEVAKAVNATNAGRAVTAVNPSKAVKTPFVGKKTIAAPQAMPLAARVARAPRRAPAPPAKVPAPTKALRIEAQDLIARGVPRTVFQSWIASGALLRSGDRGIYLTTASTEEKIAAYLARMKR